MYKGSGLVPIVSYLNSDAVLLLLCLLSPSITCGLFLFFVRAVIYLSSLLLFIGGFGSGVESVSRLQGTFFSLTLKWYLLYFLSFETLQI